MTTLFTDEDLIQTYGDAQALEDGVLVDLIELFGGRVMFRGRAIDRMTSNLLGQMLPFLLDRNNPLAPAPTEIEGLTPGHIRDLRHTIQQKLRYVRDTATEAGATPNYLFELPPNLWLVDNERGNWTLMLPEDY